MDEWRKKTMHTPEEQILQIGRMEQNPEDEMGAPHFHLRRAWPCKDEETGLTTTDQTKALLKAGILPPDLEKKISKKNNPKMTFDKMCREKWIFIARSHGLEIEDTPKPRDEVGKTLEEFQKEKDLQRNRVYTLLSALTENNIDVLEEVSKWEELMPSIQNFREWMQRRPWYREFELGREAERKLKREREWER